MTDQHPPSPIRGPFVGILAWLVPGLGHWYLGHRNRAIVFLITITLTFWTGIAIGGVRSTVDTNKRKLWFMAQVGSGGNALGALAFRRMAAQSSAPDGPYISSEVGVHYTGVAGLLNVLVILDALGRAELNGRSSASQSQTRNRGSP